MGTRYAEKIKRKGAEDHPHACGDKIFQLFYPKVCQGSSPRVWGQELLTFANGNLCRIIPTRVGTSFSINFMCFKIEDHPHACGDKRLLFGGNKHRRGSSPRVWGQEALVRWQQTQARIIPTRVGTSCY